MAIIPLIFKNDDTVIENADGSTTPVYSRTGKVPPSMGRAINAYSLYNKCGIFKGYGYNCKADVISTSFNKTTISIKKGLVSIYGGVILIEDGTTFEFSTSANTTGYIGITVDLSKDAGQEVTMFAKTSGFNKDDLQANEVTGKFDLILFKYTSSADGTVNNDNLKYYNQFTQTEEPAFVYDANQVIDLLINGNITVKQAEKAQKITYTTTVPTASPEEGTFLIYVGGVDPEQRYDRVIYLIY